MDKLLTNISKTISILLQPLLMPLYSVILLAYYTSFYDSYRGGLTSFIFPVFLLSFFIPILGIIILRSVHTIRSLSLEAKKDRIYPLVSYIVSSICLGYFFLQVEVPHWFIGLLCSGTIVAVIGLIFNFFWKISLHMMAIGALIGTSLVICLKIFDVNPHLLFVVLFILSGILGTSRLYLNRSTPAQIYVGFILGFLIGFISIVMSVLFYY